MTQGAASTKQSSLGRLLLSGTRPRTLPSSLVPVAIGTAVVASGLHWGRVVACAVVALFLQIATNFANDYSDGVRGTDDERRGPLRLVGSGLVSPKIVASAAATSFALAALAGLWLASVTSWWLLPLGASAIAAGYFYTGGPKPYGYLGLGECFVFVYFGLMATVGSSYVQGHGIPSESWWLGSASGLLAVALLEANNVRDRPGDEKVGKRTLAVRMGPARAPWLYVLAVNGAALSLCVASWHMHWLLAVAIGLVLMAMKPIRILRRASGLPDYIATLKATASLQLAFGAATLVVLLLSPLP